MPSEGKPVQGAGNWGEPYFSDNWLGFAISQSVFLFMFLVLETKWQNIQNVQLTFYVNEW